MTSGTTNADARFIFFAFKNTDCKGEKTMKPLPTCADLKGAHRLAALIASGGKMLRKFTTLVIAALIGNGFTAYSQTPSAKEFKLKQQIVEYGTEQNVKIKLKSEEVLQGRIVEIKNESFTLQVVDLNAQVVNRRLAYNELSKVSKVGVGENRKALRRGLLQGAGAMAAAIGIMLVISLIASATID